MCFVDFSERFDRYFDGLDVVHGGNGMGQMIYSSYVLC